MRSVLTVVEVGRDGQGQADPEYERDECKIDVHAGHLRLSVFRDAPGVLRDESPIFEGPFGRRRHPLTQAAAAPNIDGTRNSRATRKRPP
jgi:hypothetical protein